MHKTERQANSPTTQNKQEKELTPSASAVQTPKLSPRIKIEFPSKFLAEKFPIKSQSESSSKDGVKVDISALLSPSKASDTKYFQFPIHLPQKGAKKQF